MTSCNKKPKMHWRMFFRIGYSFQTLSPCQASFWEAWKWNKADFCNFDLCKTWKTKTTVYRRLLPTLFSCKQLLKMKRELRIKTYYLTLIKYLFGHVQTFFILFWKHLSPKSLIALGWPQQWSLLLMISLTFCTSLCLWKQQKIVSLVWADRSTIPVTAWYHRSALPAWKRRCSAERFSRHVWLGLLSQAKYEVWFSLNWLSSHQKYLNGNNFLFSH